MSNFRQHIKDNPLEELKIFSGKFISIGLLVKYPERFEEYLSDLEINSYDIKNFEVNIAVPDNESEFQAISKVIEKTPIEVRVVSDEEYQLWLDEAKIKFAKEEIFENNKLIASNKQ